LISPVARQPAVDLFPDLLVKVPPMPGGSFHIERIWSQIRDDRTAVTARSHTDIVG
jgi:hypothetical protein